MTPDVVQAPYKIFIGVDVDKRSFALTAVDGAGLKHSGKMPSDPEQLYRFIQNRYGGCRVLCTYEAGSTGYHLYDYLQERGQACQVVSPLGIPKPPNQVVKNNRLDSEKLAVESRKGDLTPISGCRRAPIVNCGIWLWPRRTMPKAGSWPNNESRPCCCMPTLRVGTARRAGRTAISRP